MSDRRRRTPGCLPGCGGFLFVLILGGALSLFNTAFGLGVSVGVPLTQSSISFAGSIGAKERAAQALPAYVRERIAGTQNFINQTNTLTVGPAEGIGLFIVGHQDGAPALDLFVVLR